MLKNAHKTGKSLLTYVDIVIKDDVVDHSKYYATKGRRIFLWFSPNAIFKCACDIPAFDSNSLTHGFQITRYCDY